jgi:ribonucleoside-triphosphate reductase
MNGVDFDHFNFIHQIEKVISEKLNDVSIDDNSNKNEKTIAGIYAEAIAPIKKVVGFDYLYRVMKEMYGKNKAKRLAATMYDYSIGLSDSTNILLPYCYSLDASKLVLLGRDFGQLPSGPAKRISSYISALCETVHQLSSHFAGAVAIGTFFFDISHLAYYKMNLDRENLNDPKCRKHFENEFQQFVHSVNHLSRNSNESPFTNVSVFDKTKLKYIVENDLN